MICRLGLCIDGAWVYKETGAENTNVEAVKSGLTDALQRVVTISGIGVT